MDAANTRIIYNVTTKPDRAVAGSWLKWLKEEHIPAVISTGCFTHAGIFRLLDIDDTDGPTFAVQYHAISKAKYESYISEYADSLRQQSFDKWGDRFISFRSVLEVVD
jgi:hypothetical protein